MGSKNEYQFALFLILSPFYLLFIDIPYSYTYSLNKTK
jgi:hypothetical protein